MFMRDSLHMEVEDEEEDDLDFSPVFIGETPSEASSSLSSENENPSVDVIKEIRSSFDGKMDTPSSKPEEKLESCSQESVNDDEDPIMQFDDASRKSLKLFQFQTYTEVCNKDISSENGCCAGVPVASHQEENIEPAVDDDDDAICRRTRARQSLANYTLEELETFLQESDVDDDLHNVDDKEEYHKFLAAVLLKGDEDGQGGQGERTFDEDEESDADFEVELEEALESDIEETTRCCTEHKRKQYDEARVPETRQKKRLKESSKSKKFVLGQAKAPLRPIYPYLLNSQRSPFPSFTWEMSSPKHLSSCFSSVSGPDLINGFTACQVGQLYCLIHEHVQLLLQVFSISVLDPSRRQVANDLRKLISEIIGKHEMALSMRKVPYPPHCFQFSNLHNSLQVESNKSDSYWTPVIDKPVLSILDLAPLRLAKHYMDDIAEIVSRHRQSCLEGGSAKSHLYEEPLFSLPVSTSLGNTSMEVLGGSAKILNTVPSSSCQVQPGQQQPKKSLAATLVESTMKQSIALVPVGIAKLAQRFFRLFNAALFPHKPPIPAITNRILFTDAEDGLLALGIMEHNSDWEAIQQHFLPCKSTHQIFVRQKNRCSSKAPENQIKEVRRVKGSPLTEDEKTLIYEGLRIFKHDWLSVWKYFVPHRDPSMLPRQWRVATGTQKSYRKTEPVKEKRRLYEAKRRSLKARTTDIQTLEKEVNNGDNSDDEMDCEDEANVHEAFLEDSESGSSRNIAHNVRLSCINSFNTQAVGLMQYNGSGNGAICASIANDSGEARVENGNNVILKSSMPAKDVHSLHQVSHIRYGASYSISSRHLSSCSISGTSGGHLAAQSYRARKRKGLRVVKLSPDLPPVNLPPSVRVISQSAFKIFHGETLHSNAHANSLNDRALSVTHVTETGIRMINHIKNTCKLLDYQSSDPHSDGKYLTGHVKENAPESEAHLHPLLFQNPSQYACSTIDLQPLQHRPENFSEEPALLSAFDGLAAGAENVNHFVNGAQSQYRSDQPNKIDLNMQLSSSANRQGTDAIYDHENIELNASMPVERMEKVVQASLGPFEELDASRETNLLLQSATFYSKDGFDLETVPQGHDISFHQCIQDFHTESNQGIVMEQEELSDSEDENENVIFECEDLEDSEEEEEEESCEEPIKIHDKVPGLGDKDDEIQAAQYLHQLHQSGSISKAAAKRGKGSVDAMPAPPGELHTKLTRSKNENNTTKRDRSCQSSPIAPPSNRSRKKMGEENSSLRTAEGKAAGSRRSKRKPPLH